MVENPSRSTTLKTKGLLAGIFFAGLALRTAFLWYWETRQLDGLFLHDGYVTLAQYWLGWIPEITDFDKLNPAPGFAMWCAVVFKIVGGPNMMAVRILNVLFSSVICLLVFRLARERADDNTALFAAFFAAVSPSLVFFSPHLQSESFFLFWETIFLIFLLHFDRFTLAQAALFGLFAVWVCLVRSAFAIALPFIVIALCVQGKNSSLKYMRIGIFLCFIGLPLILRGFANLKTHGRFIPLTAQTGLAVYAGISLTAEDRHARIVPVWGEMQEQGIVRYIDQDKYFLKKGIDFIKENPLRYAKIVVKKFFQYWRPWPRPPYPPVARWIIGGFYTALFGLGLIGLAFTFSRPLEYVTAYALIASFSIAHAFFDASLRYRMPLEPWLCVFAAIGVSRIWKGFSAR